MKARKYGAISRMRNAIVRKHLFFNQRKNLSLDKITEWCGGRKEVWFEVTAVSIAENTFSLVRELKLSTTVYALAWGMVRDEREN